MDEIFLKRFKLRVTQVNASSLYYHLKGMSSLPQDNQLLLCENVEIWFGILLQSCKFLKF